MEALRESFLNLTFQMSLYKRATLDEEDLLDSAGDDIYPSSPMQVNVRQPWLKNVWEPIIMLCQKEQTTISTQHIIL